MTQDRVSETIDQEALAERLVEAMDGAYWAAPQGEGVSGAWGFAVEAAINVLNGMAPGDAVAQAVGEHGTYGVRRTHSLVPRPQPWGIQPDADAPGVYLAYETAAQRDECVRALTSVEKIKGVPAQDRSVNNSTAEESDSAAADLRLLRMILSAFPAETAEERRNLKDWMHAVDLGAQALAEIEIRKRQIGLLGNCLSHIENSAIAPEPIRVAATAALAGAMELTESLK